MPSPKASAKVSPTLLEMDLILPSMSEKPVQGLSAENAVQGSPVCFTTRGRKVMLHDEGDESALFNAGVGKVSTAIVEVNAPTYAPLCDEQETSAARDVTLQDERNEAVANPEHEDSKGSMEAEMPTCSQECSKEENSAGSHAVDRRHLV